MFARISKARRFQSNSEISGSADAETLLRSLANSAVACRHSSHCRTCRFSKKRETIAQSPAEKVEGGIGGDARKPVRRFFQILQLFLPLQRLNKGLLRQILSVMDITHQTIDLAKDPAHVVGDKLLLNFT